MAHLVKEQFIFSCRCPFVVEMFHEVLGLFTPNLHFIVVGIASANYYNGAYKQRP